MKAQLKIIGTLLPISALVSKTEAKGTFKAGEVFVHWLAKTKQRAWQVLPLHETQLEDGSPSLHVASPYKGYGIGLDPRYLGGDETAISPLQVKSFVSKNSEWIHDYALFCALRDRYLTDRWSEWPSAIRLREPRAMEECQRGLEREIQDYVVEQCRTDLAYAKLRKLVKSMQIRLMGDVPFYLSLNSPLVWQYQHLFEVESDGTMSRVSGVLDGQRAHFGRQIWGHPLYRFAQPDLFSELQTLFEIRIKYMARLYDMVRLDHARGFFTYGAMDLEDASRDVYLSGPGENFLKSIIAFAGHHNLKLYAEDTGESLQELRVCLRRHRLPGIKILRFAYNEKRHSYVQQYLRTNQYPHNTVAYTTTHDTETLVGYLNLLSEGERSDLQTKLGLAGLTTVASLASGMRDLVIASPAKIVLVPLQDWLLRRERINVPGTEKEVNDTNWRYRMSVPIEELPDLEIN